LKMMLKNVGSFVAKENRKPVGIVTERDFVRVCTETSDVRCFENKVRAVMSTPLTTIEPETPILEALEIMLGNSVRRLPATQNGELRGIITESDIVVWVLRETYEPHLPEYLKNSLTRSRDFRKSDFRTRHDRLRSNGLGAHELAL